MQRVVRIAGGVILSTPPPPSPESWPLARLCFGQRSCPAVTVAAPVPNGSFATTASYVSNDFAVTVVART